MSSERLKDVLFEAFELGESERDAFLVRACAGDEALLAEARRLARAHAHAQGFLGDDEPTAVIDSDAGPTLPREIGGRRVVRKLGEGGFGVVYLAEQDEPVRKRVAVKVVRPGMGSEQVLARFETERRALELMGHPCIAGVIDAGTTRDALPYFVLEYVDGTAITTYVERRQLSLRARLELFRQVCAAVQHAHQKGVIHRDLKPSNVLVTEIDGVPTPKVIDFGIAKAVQGPLSDRTVITQSAQIIGTPQYMSPEQVSFGRVDVDTRSDVYSLGALLYEVLTAAPPFDASQIANVGPAELERLICDVAPARPSTRVLSGGIGTPSKQQLSRELRGDLDWVVARAMEKDRSRRYQSPAEFSEDIQRYLDGEAVEAGPPSGLYRLRKMVLRHRIEFAAAGSVAMALVAVVVVSLVFAARADRARQDAETELSKFQAVSGFTKEMLSGIDPAIARGADTTLFRSILDQAAERVGERAGDQPAVEVELRTTIGQSYQSVALLEAAEEQLVLARGVALAELGDADPLTHGALSALAEVYAGSGRQEDALGMFREVHAQRRALYGAEHALTLKSLSNVGAVLNGMGRYEESYEVQERVLAGRRRALGMRHEETMATMNNIATLLDDLNRTEESVPLLEEVLDYQLETNGEDHPQTLATMNNLAFSLDDIGRWQESEAMYRRVLGIKERVLPEGHPSTIITLNNLATHFGNRGKPEPAIEILSGAVELSTEHAGATHYRTLMLQSNLAANLSRAGRDQEACDLLERTVAGLSEVIGDRRPETIASSSQHATVLRRLGRLDEAETITTGLLAYAADALPPNHRLLAGLHLSHGRTLAGLGRAGEAESHLLGAARIAEARYGEGAGALREYYEALREHYGSTGEAEKRADWDRKIEVLPAG